ncbi:MAG TPA: hypothetical protein VIJ77_06460 [Candidatus Tumulicola sp.]
MKRMAAILVATTLFATTTTIAARAVTVRLLSLPRHATIEPFAARALMAVAADGTIAATLTVNGFVVRPIVWDRRGAYRLPNARGSIAGFDDANGLLINAGRPARLGAGTRVSAVDLASCENFPQASTGPTLAGVLSNGALIATMQSPAMVNLDDTSGQNAPVVLHLRSRQCLNVGNGIALATAGLYAVGYVAYIANVPAPSNVVSRAERFTAMRWHERTREPLGAGVAVAVNAAGAAAGADVPPGNGAAYGVSAHARYWPGDGSVVEVAPASPRSTAYAIDARNRIAGMLEDAHGRHYAFLWQNGTLHRLDDVAAASGWRFECAYAFAPDGAIVGIGTYRGNAAAFEITGL